MNGRRGIAGAVAIWGLALAAEAHLVAGSLSIKGGETFSAGSTVNVKWSQDVGHDGKYDFKYSKDGGTTWTDVEKNKQLPTAAGEITYVWTVPGEATTQGQFRVCQQAGGAACTDATYMLKSPNFTVTAGSPVRPAAVPEAGSLAYDARTRNLEVSLDLASRELVNLDAFDSRGKLLAILLDGFQDAGERKLSVFSSRLDDSQAMVFRLRVGARIRTEAWKGTR